MEHAAFEKVLEQGAQLQARLAHLTPVAVGGTAVALHCHHRYSLDVDVVSQGLAARYDEVLERLESWEGWCTNRKTPPVLILGERNEVELGVRQQRRSVPLRVTRLQGLTVPTASEMLRVKAFLLAERRSTRDYLDVAALADLLGSSCALAALRYLNAVYAPVPPLSWISCFSEACESEPIDREEIDLTLYRGLQEPYLSWTYVSARCRELGHAILKQELTTTIPAAPDTAFDREEAP